MQRREPLADSDVIDLPNIRLDAFAFGIGRRQVIQKLLKIALVISQCVRAEITLIMEMIEELREKIIEHGQGYHALDHCEYADSAEPGPGLSYSACAPCLRGDDQPEAHHRDTE